MWTSATSPSSPTRSPDDELSRRPVTIGAATAVVVPEVGLLEAHVAVAALEVRGLRVRYGDRVAVDGVDIVARAGEITGVVGPNGSGKTSVLNAITGAVPHSAASLKVFGEELASNPPERLFAAGLTRTFQNLHLVDEITVQENVRVGSSLPRSAGAVRSMLRTPGIRRDLRRRDAQTHEALERMGILAHRREVVARLPYGIRRRVEVARALASGPRVLLLDEPTAGLGPDESLEFASALQQIVADSDLAVVIVEHDMVVVRKSCDHVYVLAQGQVLGQGPPAEILADERVRKVYLGDFGHDTA